MPKIYRFFCCRSEEYGFLFSFGGSAVLPHCPALPIIFIHTISQRSQIISAAAAQQTDSFNTKCKASKTAAGIIPSKFKSILISRQIKKLPLSFVLRIPFAPLKAFAYI